jgi:hypothetical protein
MSGIALALRILDEVQHLAQLDAFDPARFLLALEEASLGARPSLADVGGALDGARDLSSHIDRFAQKSMRIRLNHVGGAVPDKLRVLLQTTIVAYAEEPALLRARVGAVLGRADPAAAAALTDEICEAAARVLAARATLRQGVLELARRTAAALLPAARQAARDRTQDDEERGRWARARVDLERVAARGETIEAGAFGERLAKIEPVAAAAEAEEPEQDPTSVRFSLLELD